MPTSKCSGHSCVVDQPRPDAGSGGDGVEHPPAEVEPGVERRRAPRRRGATARRPHRAPAWRRRPRSPRPGQLRRTPANSPGSHRPSAWCSSGSPTSRTRCAGPASRTHLGLGPEGGRRHAPRTGPETKVPADGVAPASEDVCRDLCRSSQVECIPISERNGGRRAAPPPCHRRRAMPVVLDRCPPRGPRYAQLLAAPGKKNGGEGHPRRTRQQERPFHRPRARRRRRRRPGLPGRGPVGPPA